MGNAYGSLTWPTTAPLDPLARPASPGFEYETVDDPACVETSAACLPSVPPRLLTQPARAGMTSRSRRAAFLGRDPRSVRNERKNSDAEAPPCGFLSVFAA